MGAKCKEKQGRGSICYPCERGDSFMLRVSCAGFFFAFVVVELAK